MDIDQLSGLKVAELREIAKNRGIFDSYKYKKEELILKIAETYKIYDDSAQYLKEEEFNNDIDEQYEDAIKIDEDIIKKPRVIV